MKRISLFGLHIWISRNPLRVRNKDRKRNDYRNQQRNIRLEMADFRCEVCGRPIDNTCHIHRNLPMGAPDRYKADNIRVMCGHCWRELEKKPHIHGYQHIEDTTRYDARD